MNQVSQYIEENNQKVELFLSCRKLKNMDVLSLTDPQVKVYLERKGNYIFFEQTEIIQDNLDPNFTKSFLLDYVFETKQKLKFEVLNTDGRSKFELCGNAETTLGEIIGSKNMTMILDVKNNGKSQGKLIIKAEKVASNYSVVEATIFGHKLENTRFMSKSSPVLKLSRMAGDSGFVAIYESEVVHKNLNPRWAPFEIEVRKLCNGDYQRPIRAEIYSRSRFNFKDTFMGACQFTVDDLSNREERKFVLTDKSKKKTGHLFFEKFKLSEKPGFLDYLRGGTQLSVMVAIDFTGSNGDPISPDSLHAIKYDGSLNEYQKAILGVCDILLHYDADKKVPLFGFGGKPRFPTFSSQNVSHCFSLTGDQGNPWAYGLDGIMQTYLSALNQVELSGPTLFTPILQTAMKIANQSKIQGSVEYTVLLIITDGEIHDMEQTINCLIKSAELPLSVIIVGVGKADFTNMIILDGDDGLFNSDGVKAKRDLVQFVPFRDFQGSQELLAKHVLEEVPKQVVEYYTSMGIIPKPAEAIDINQLLRGNTLEEGQYGNPSNGVPGYGGNANGNGGENVFMAPSNHDNAAHYSNISFFAGNQAYNRQPQQPIPGVKRRNSLTHNHQQPVNVDYLNQTANEDAFANFAPAGPKNY